MSSWCWSLWVLSLWFSMMLYLRRVLLRKEKFKIWGTRRNLSVTKSSVPYTLMFTKRVYANNLVEKFVTKMALFSRIHYWKRINVCKHWTQTKELSDIRFKPQKPKHLAVSSAKASGYIPIWPKLWSVSSLSYPILEVFVSQKLKIFVDADHDMGAKRKINHIDKIYVCQFWGLKLKYSRLSDYVNLLRTCFVFTLCYTAIVFVYRFWIFLKKFTANIQHAWVIDISYFMGCSSFIVAIQQ